MTIYKLGVSYDVDPAWTLRAGFSFTFNNKPIPPTQTLFNMLAPATIQDHLTLGATWKIDPKQELSFAYMHAFENQIKGQNAIPQGFGGGTVYIKMHQDSLGVSYGYKF